MAQMQWITEGERCRVYQFKQANKFCQHWYFPIWQNSFLANIPSDSLSHIWWWCAG